MRASRIPGFVVSLLAVCFAKAADPPTPAMPNPSPAHSALHPNHRTTTKHLDLTRPPETDELIAAGLNSRNLSRVSLDRTFYAGDSWPTPKGPRRLHRVAGALALRFEDGKKDSALARLTRTNEILSTYEQVDFGRGYMLVQSVPGESRHLNQPDLLDRLIAAAAKENGVRAAAPVFVKPDTGLRIILTDEIIVCLKPGVDPITHFAVDPAHVKPLHGTHDQFVITLAGDTYRAILNQLDSLSFGFFDVCNGYQP